MSGPDTPPIMAVGFWQPWYIQRLDGFIPGVLFEPDTR
jgi:hypothetical protein